MSCPDYNTPFPVTLDMISAGADAYRDYDPETEDPEALVFAIIYRAFKIAEANRTALMCLPPALRFPPIPERPERSSDTEPPP
jgi:hypothetical protein